MLALSLRLCMVNRQGKAVYLYNCVYISKVYFIFGQSQDFIILIVLGGKIICIYHAAWNVAVSNFCRPPHLIIVISLVDYDGMILKKIHQILLVEIL